MKRALFLDRDGVVNKEKNHIYKIEDFEFINGVFETCKYFIIYIFGFLVSLYFGKANTCILNLSCCLKFLH